MNSMIVSPSTSWSRQYKNQARDLAQPRTPVARSLWLPGGECLDVLQTHQAGLLLRGSHVAVEREPAVMGQVKSLLGPLGLGFDYQQVELEDASPPAGLQYAHCDICGSISYRIAAWTARLRPAPGATLCFTFTYARRSNLFLETCHELFNQQDEYHEILVKEYCELARDDINIALMGGILRCLLRQHSFSAVQPVFYKDAIQSMVLYRFDDVEILPRPRYPDLLSDIRPYMRRRSNGC